MMNPGIIASSRRRSSGLILPTFGSGSGRGVASAATSIVITKPTGTAIGHLLLTFCLANNSSGTYDPPDGGWQHVTGSPEAIGCATFWKYATQTEVDAGSFTFGRSTNTAGAAIGIMLRYVYASGSPTPQKVNQTSASGTSIALAEVTGITDGLLIHVVSKVTGTSGAFTAPGGAETIRMPSQNTGGTLIQFATADEPIAAGDSGTRTWPYAGSSASRGALLALPAA